jgi:hypothetical protein
MITWIVGHPIASAVLIALLVLVLLRLSGVDGRIAVTPLQLLRDVFREWARSPNRASEPQCSPCDVDLKDPPHRVEFAAFLPRSIANNMVFILDIWAYVPSAYAQVAQIAGELGRSLITGRKLGESVSKGVLLTIRVDLPHLSVEDPIDTVEWDGEPVNATYIVRVPRRMRPGVYAGKAFISCEGIPVARLVFAIPVSRDASLDYVDVSTKTVWPKSAFASYAAKDREQVLSRIQGMSKLAPNLDIFVDVFSLRSGDRWQEQLEKHVPNKDVFFLFWSRHAARSIWVGREWRLALVTRGLDYIDPVPIEEPDLCPPPEELRQLHFRDKYIESIVYHRLNHKYREEIIRERLAGISEHGNKVCGPSHNRRRDIHC